MSDQIRAGLGTGGKELRESDVTQAQRDERGAQYRKKMLMIFGKDQSPDDIVATIAEAHKEAAE